MRMQLEIAIAIIDTRKTLQLTNIRRSQTQLNVSYTSTVAISFIKDIPTNSG